MLHLWKSWNFPLLKVASKKSTYIFSSSLLKHLKRTKIYCSAIGTKQICFCWSMHFTERRNKNGEIWIWRFEPWICIVICIQIEPTKLYGCSFSAIWLLNLFYFIVIVLQKKNKKTICKTKRTSTIHARNADTKLQCI